MKQVVGYGKVIRVEADTIFDVTTGDTPCKVWIYNYDKYVVMCKGYTSFDGGSTPIVEE